MGALSGAEAAEVARLTKSVGASPAILATLVSALIEDVKKLDARLTKVASGHADHESQLTEIKGTIDVLVTNIQGYSDPEEELRHEREERAHYIETHRESLSAVPWGTSMISSEEADKARARMETEREIPEEEPEEPPPEPTPPRATTPTPEPTPPRAATPEPTPPRAATSEPTPPRATTPTPEPTPPRAATPEPTPLREEEEEEEEKKPAAEEEPAPTAKKDEPVAVDAAATPKDDAVKKGGMTFLEKEAAEEEEGEEEAPVVVNKKKKENKMASFGESPAAWAPQRSLQGASSHEVETDVDQPSTLVADRLALVAETSIRALAMARSQVRVASALRKAAAVRQKKATMPPSDAAGSSSSLERRGSSLSRFKRPSLTIEAECSARARKRWRWAFFMIKLQRMQRRMPMNKVKTDRKHSIAARLQRLEEALDTLKYDLAQVAKQKTSMNGDDDGALLTLTRRQGALDLKVASIGDVVWRADEAAMRADDAAATLRRDVDNLRRDTVRSMELSQAAHDLAERVLNDAGGSGAAAARRKLPSLRARAAALARRLLTLCKAAAQDRDLAFARGGQHLLYECCRPLADFLDDQGNNLETTTRTTLAAPTTAKKASSSTEDWNGAALETMRAVHTALLRDDAVVASNRRDNDPTEGETKKKKSLVDVVPQHYYDATKEEDEDKPGEEEEEKEATTTARSVAEELRLVLAEALEADEGVVAVRRAFIGLDTWAIGPGGPLNARLTLERLDAGIVGCQARLGALTQVPDQVGVVKTRLRRLEVSEDQRVAENAHVGASFSPEAIRRSFSQLGDVHRELQEALFHVRRLESAVDCKADYLPTRDHLDFLRNEVLKLARFCVPKHDLKALLKDKVDKKDLAHLAALVAQGNAAKDPTHPGQAILAAKLQVPDFRCICCDTPLCSKALDGAALLQGQQFAKKYNTSASASSSSSSSYAPVALPRAPTTSNHIGPFANAKAHATYPHGGHHHNHPEVHDGASVATDTSLSTKRQLSLGGGGGDDDDASSGGDSATFSRYPRLMPAKQPANAKRAATAAHNPANCRF